MMRPWIKFLPALCLLSFALNLEGNTKTWVENTVQFGATSRYLPTADSGVAPQKLMTLTKLSKTPTEASQVKQLLDEAKVQYQAVAEVNWDAYPYKPTVQVRLAYTADAFLIHFKVDEKEIRAVAAADNGRVYEDACVEFFVQPFADQSYYNFEFSCIGKLLLQGGAKGDRKMAPPEILKSIKRWSSLGDQPFDTKAGNHSWELTAVIPYSAFFRHPQTAIQEEIKANFYKCGDKLPTPHFVSWNKILTEKPNFHAPEFFGRIKLTK